MRSLAAAAHTNTHLTHVAGSTFFSALASLCNDIIPCSQVGCVITVHSAAAENASALFAPATNDTHWTTQN